MGSVLNIPKKNDAFYPMKFTENCGIEKDCKQGLEQGIEQGVLQVAQNLIKMNRDIRAIIEQIDTDYRHF